MIIIKTRAVERAQTRGFIQLLTITMTSNLLTHGALMKMYSVTERKKFLETPFNVRIINLKYYDDAENKVRVIVYDGIYNSHGVLNQKLVQKLESQGFTRGSIIKIKKHHPKDTLRFYSYIDDADVIQTEDLTSYPEPNKVSDYFAANPEMNYYTHHPEEQTSYEDSAKPVKQAVSTPAVKLKPGPKVNGNVVPIELLSPYQNSWTIKARVSYKGDIRTWNNAKGSGKLFNVNFLDESDEIRATAFNEMAEKLYEFLQEGKVYYVSRGRIQSAKPQFSRLSHPYELSLDKDSVVEECFDSVEEIPKLHFNFTKLDLIQKAEQNAIVDVIGVLREVKPAFQITSKATGKPFDRRDIAIVDDSNFSITVGLWNNTAIDFNLSEGSVLAIKGCKIQDFGGRSLTLTQTGSIVPNPDTSEAYKLKGWYDNQGSGESFKSLKPEHETRNLIETRKTILQAQDENLGLNEKSDFFNVKATINFFKTDTFSYPACINQNSGDQQGSCNRKIIDQGNGTWRCEKCDIVYDQPNYRYILNCSIMDATGQLWTTLFDAEAAKVLGVSANELYRLSMEDNDQFKAIVENATMKEYSFRIKARLETYNGNTRIRYQTNTIRELDFNSEAEYLIRELNSIL